MKKTTMLTVSLLSFALSTQAFAQGEINNKEEYFDTYKRTQTGEAFDKFAGDDGEMSFDEFKRMNKTIDGKADFLTTEGYDAEKRFNMADTNGDGIVTKAEAGAQKRKEMKNKDRLFSKAKENYQEGDEQSRRARAEERFKNMTPEERRAWAAENPEKAARFKQGAKERFQNLSPEEKREWIKNNPEKAERMKGAVKNRAQDMTPEERRAWAEKNPGKAERIKARREAAGQGGKLEALKEKRPGAARKAANNPGAAQKFKNGAQKRPNAARAAAKGAAKNPDKARAAAKKANNNRDKARSGKQKIHKNKASKKQVRDKGKQRRNNR